MLLEDVYYTNIKHLCGRLTSYGHLLFFRTFSHRLTYFFKPCFHVFLSNLMILKISNTQHKTRQKTTQQPKCNFLSTVELLHLVVFLSLTTTFSQTKSHAAKARCSRRCCCCSSSKAKASARMRAASWGLQYHGPPKPTSLEGFYGK